MADTSSKNEDFGRPLYPMRDKLEEALQEKQRFSDRRLIGSIEHKVVKCFSKCGELRILAENLEKQGCDFNLRRNISVEKCEQSVYGGYDPLTNQVVLCYNTLPVRRTCRLLFHEMIHAYDHCRTDMDFNNIQQLACTEIRAASLAECSMLSSFVDGSSNLKDFITKHQACVKKRALRSILTTRNITREQGREIIDSVFDRCYSDLEPFGEHKTDANTYYLQYQRLKHTKNKQNVPSEKV